MRRFVVTMYWETKQDGGSIKRAIPVGVVTVRPTEAILSSAVQPAAVEIWKFV